MKTTTLQGKTIAYLERIEPEKPPPSVRKAEISEPQQLTYFLLGWVALGFLWRIFGAWIGRESIRIQTEPGKFVSRTEEYQDLHSQVGPNSFFRMF